MAEESNDHIPKISIYEPPVTEKSGTTIKPVLAGAMLIIFNIFLIYLIITTHVSLFIIILLVISTFGGVLTLQRKQHKICLLCTVLTFIGGLGFGYGFLAIVPFFLIVISDDEFSS